MPHIQIKNTSPTIIQQLSKDFTSILAQEIGCPNDWLTFHHIESHMFMEGSPVSHMAFVCVEWFARTQEVQDKIAKILSDALLSESITEVVVTFLELDPKQYYENGILC